MDFNICSNNEEEAGEIEGASSPKYRKINYVPVKCFLCDENHNPKKVISLTAIK